MRVRAFVAHDAHRPHIGGEYREALPQLAFETGLVDLVTNDRVGVLQGRDAFWGDLTEDPHAKTRPGERLPEHDLVGQTELFAQLADLILEQIAQWFDQLQRHVLGQAAHVVMTLDDRGGAVSATTLDHVGVQRALHQVLGIAEATGVLLEDAHEQLADDLALCLRFDHPGQLLEVARTGRHMDQLDAHVALERLDHLIALVQPHQTGVDVDADQLVADGLVDECSGDGGVDTATQRTDHSS